MAYEPKEWVNGDVILASDLNHIENGIANQIVIKALEYDSETSTLSVDITPNQFKQFIEHNIPVIVVDTITYQITDDSPMWAYYLPNMFDYAGTYSLVCGYYSLDSNDGDTNFSYTFGEGGGTT